MGCPWCVQPQLGSLLVVQPVGAATAQVRYGGSSTDILSAKGQWCASFNFGKAVSADYSCNPDFNVAQVGVVTRWTPVKNLTFSAEVGAFFLDQKFTGAATLTTVAAPKPTAIYEFKDQSTVYLNLRLSVTSDPERLETLRRTPGRQLPGVFLCRALKRSLRPCSQSVAQPANSGGGVGGEGGAGGSVEA